MGSINKNFREFCLVTSFWFRLCLCESVCVVSHFKLLTELRVDDFCVDFKFEANTSSENVQRCSFYRHRCNGKQNSAKNNSEIVDVRQWSDFDDDMLQMHVQASSFNFRISLNSYFPVSNSIYFRSFDLETKKKEENKSLKVFKNKIMKIPNYSLCEVITVRLCVIKRFFFPFCFHCFNCSLNRIFSNFECATLKSLCDLWCHLTKAFSLRQNKIVSVENLHCMWMGDWIKSNT